MAENPTRPLGRVHACGTREGRIPEPRPVLSAQRDTRVLIVGQARGRKVRETGAPWNDPSGARCKKSLSETVQAWRKYWSACLPRPHTSPRNIGWFQRHAWLEAEVISALHRHPAIRTIYQELH